MPGRSRDLFAVISLTLLFALAQSSSEEEMNGMVSKCLADNDIERMEYEMMINKTSSDAKLDNVEKKYKCFLHCMATEMNIVDSDGFLDLRLIEEKEKLSASERQTYIDCKQVHDGADDLCEYYYNMTMCLLENLQG